MKKKFIKDTNKQYSIREDGVVIRHYKLKFNSTAIQYYKDEVVNTAKQVNRHYITTYINRKKIIINVLLREYFNKVICRKCNNIFKPSAKADSLCPICLKTNRDISISIPSKDITKAYVASILKIRTEDLPDDLYKLKKITLKTKRTLCQEKQTTQN